MNKHFERLYLNVDKERLAKIKYIADYEKRISVNQQILILIRQCIRKHERENGEIEL